MISSLHVLFTVLSAFMIMICHWYGRTSPSTEPLKVYIPPPQHIHHLAFGYKESMADGFWLRAIQDFEVCGGAESDGRSSTGLNLGRAQSEDSRHLVKDLRNTHKVMLHRKKCEKGWVFRLLEAVSRLAPRFRMVYALGAPVLSVVVEDREGAKVLFLRGVKAFPDDWSLHYRAAYHFLFEMNDLPQAAKMLKKSAELGAPLWVHSLAARVYTQTGRLDLGLATLRQYQKLLRTSEQKRRLQVRISRLEKEWREHALSEKEQKKK